MIAGLKRTILLAVLLVLAGCGSASGASELTGGGSTPTPASSSVATSATPTATSASGSGSGSGSGSHANDTVTADLMAASASRIVFYAKGSGVPRVQTARIDGNGNLVVLQSYLNGKIGSQDIGQWTHLVATNDTFFFYNQNQHSGLTHTTGPTSFLAMNS